MSTVAASRLALALALNLNDSDVSEVNGVHIVTGEAIRGARKGKVRFAVDTLKDGSLTIESAPINTLHREAFGIVNDLRKSKLESDESQKRVNSKGAQFYDRLVDFALADMESAEIFASEGFAEKSIATAAALSNLLSLQEDKGIFRGALELSDGQTVPVMVAGDTVRVHSTRLNLEGAIRVLTAHCG